MIKKTVEVALNEQINAEFKSAYLYLSMSAYFLSTGLSGCANWMRVQYQEELAHATRFFDYVNERGGKVELSPINEVQVDFSGIVDVFEKTLEHEQVVTAMIDRLMDISIQESDHATKSFLQWFVDEQVEEEAHSKQIVDKLKLIKDSTNGLFMLDHELSERK